jgi:hypothetical protein
MSAHLLPLDVRPQSNVPQWAPGPLHNLPQPGMPIAPRHPPTLDMYMCGPCGCWTLCGSRRCCRVLDPARLLVLDPLPDPVGVGPCGCWTMFGPCSPGWTLYGPYAPCWTLYGPCGCRTVWLLDHVWTVLDPFWTLFPRLDHAWTLQGPSRDHVGSW